VSRPTGFPHTPDGRYFVVIGRAGPRLWRATNPELAADDRQRLTKQLMDARRAIRDNKDDPARIAAARLSVDAAKRGMGERGPLWWDDGVPDQNRRLVKNSTYAEWWEEQRR
jgi:hypothetical protein